MGSNEIPPGLCQCGCGTPTGVIPKNSTQAGLVKGELFRFVRGHATRQTGAYYREEDRGFATPCWIWQLGVEAGYGRIKRGGRMRQAHRHFYEQENGPLPSGHEVELHHLCEEKLCVNPSHLRPISVADHRRHHTSTATAEIVAEIRRRYVPYEVTRRMLAEEFGLSLKQVTKIVQRKSWDT